MIARYFVAVVESAEFEFTETNEAANEEEISYTDTAIRVIPEALVADYREAMKTLHKLHKLIGMLIEEV